MYVNEKAKKMLCFSTSPVIISLHYVVKLETHKLHRFHLNTVRCFENRTQNIQNPLTLSPRHSWTTLHSQNKSHTTHSPRKGV